MRTEDGCRLWADQVGAGPPLVLCHGGPGSCGPPGPVARLLDRHARVIRWDQRGCGRPSGVVRTGRPFRRRSRRGT
ncbi:alpha/beta fold hydrolase [Micromonospora sp. BRA006-A]|nr:alpha/beta fold hydrolase [Micromonospora sp. BRA006-A]